MKYYLNYQYLPKGADRPRDTGPTVELDIQKDGQALIPNVGDFVGIDNSTNEMESFEGKVKTRLFYYSGTTKTLEGGCNINIVVEETDDDWGQLIKE